MRVAVIGGGISGLSSAFLIKKALPDVEIDVFEKGDVPGGTIKTVCKDGFLMECGPNGFLSGKPSTLEIARLSLANGELVEANENAEIRYILKKGRLVPLPDSPVSFFKSPILSIKGKLEIMKEPFVKPLKDDYEETVAEFGRRRLGQEAVDFMLDPMVSGVFAGNVNNLSLKQCFPRIYQLEKDYGSLVKAMFKLKSKKASPSGRLTSFKKGMRYLIDKLIENGDFHFYCNTEVKSVEKQGDLFFLDASDKKYNAVLFAIPSYAYESIEFPDKQEVIDHLKSIYYPPMAIVSFALRSEKMINGFGFLIPSKEKRRILGSLFSSNIFENRAPDGFSLLTVMLGGDNNREVANLSRSELIDIALNEISDILSIDKREFNLIEVYKTNRAIPQYYRGHGKIVERMEKVSEKNKGIFFTGNAFYGIGINDCTARSFEVADIISNYLKGKYA
ncbi:oxygen-dependent protoporphyrinogen oxidase [Thermotomaculum hydrothermale]|uniref:Coproporphyrinogen III oxidase n=1 Tax=Thermotomaculum hydrothermale TaxID=981385 RepID=A0A7R6PGG9_9BACT|nr:protoporphyrinogen oxidase [Thermotomaculum hydrothermale]BBB33318.1 oxygen-dependent protoporphyrinogen oxidase [Thermotomaculum hydrothermale]